MKYVNVKISNSDLWLKWAFAYCCFVYLFLYIVYTVVHPQPTPPSLAGSMLSRNTELRDSLYCSLTINTKSYTVLVLMSLINHLGQLDEPVISVWGINPPIENYLKVCPNWLCRKHWWPFWCQTQGTFSHCHTDPAHWALFNTLCFLGHRTPLWYFSPHLLFTALQLASVRCHPHPLLSPPYHIPCESILSPCSFFPSKRELASSSPGHLGDCCLPVRLFGPELALYAAVLSGPLIVRH